MKLSEPDLQLLTRSAVPVGVTNGPVLLVYTFYEVSVTTRTAVCMYSEMKKASRLPGTRRTYTAVLVLVWSIKPCSMDMPGQVQVYTVGGPQ